MKNYCTATYFRDISFFSNLGNRISDKHWSNKRHIFDEIAQGINLYEDFLQHKLKKTILLGTRHDFDTFDVQNKVSNTYERAVAEWSRCLPLNRWFQFYIGSRQ